MDLIEFRKRATSNESIGIVPSYDIRPRASFGWHHEASASIDPRVLRSSFLALPLSASGYHRRPSPTRG